MAYKYITSEDVKTKPYRKAVRRTVAKESEPGDRDMFATVTRLYFQENPKAAERLLKWMKPNDA